MKYVIACALMIGLVLISSCVSTRDYDLAVSTKNRLENENAALAKRVSDQDTIIAALNLKEVELEDARSEMAKQQSTIDNLQASQKDLRMKYDELLQQGQEVLESASEEKALLSEQLSAKQAALDQKERALQFMERKLKSQEENLIALQEDVVIRERRLKELTETLNAKDSIMHSIRSSITDALRGLSSEDLSVSEYNGRVYVSLSQNLLFAKGSNVLDAAGKDAIRKIGRVLQDHPDIEINVEGHTDSDGTPEKNWDLSVTRATTVVKHLVASGLDPHQVIASGRGLYFPKVPNDDEEAKSINRRTEIILSPDLNALYSLID